MHLAPDIVALTGEIHGGVTHYLHIPVVYADNLQLVVVQLVYAQAPEHASDKLGNGGIAAEYLVYFQIHAVAFQLFFLKTRSVKLNKVGEL